MNTQKFIADQEDRLEQIERDIFREIEPTMNFAIAKMEELGPTASREEYEQALGPLNDLLSITIGSALFRRQRDITSALLDFPGAVYLPMRTTQQLMQSPLLDEPIAANFERKSPSKWMRNLFGSTRKEVEAQVESIIAGAVWAVTADLTLRTLPEVEEWQWFTERDERVCELCKPLDRMKMSRAELRALWPRHPGCRCSNLPAPAG